jgi:hypothetical protein
MVTVPIHMVLVLRMACMMESEKKGTIATHARKESPTLLQGLITLSLLLNKIDWLPQHIHIHIYCWLASWEVWESWM